MPNFKDWTEADAAQFNQKFDEQGHKRRNPEPMASELKVEGEPLKEPPRNRYWTELEEETVRRFCATGPIDIAAIALAMNRTYASVAIKLSRMGMGDRARKRVLVKQQPQKLTPCFNSIAGWQIGTGLHPKGMLGKNHSQESRAKMGLAQLGKPVPRERVMRSLKTRLERHGSIAPVRKGGSWKSQWVELGGKRFFARSLWEANYARYLQWIKDLGQIAEWDHEPKTFWFDGIKRGNVSYLPDFRVIVDSRGTEEYHEVKGWMDARSITKIKRMAKYYPSVKLVVIDSERYRKLARTCKSIVPGWA